jgi:hypothetical protein
MDAAFVIDEKRASVIQLKAESIRVAYFVAFFILDATDVDDAVEIAIVELRKRHLESLADAVYVGREKPDPGLFFTAPAAAFARHVPGPGERCRATLPEKALVIHYC